MKRYIQGDNRYKSLLFPETLDEYISEDNPVRVIDVFVEELDLSGMGFELIPADTGRPAYHPAVMLKLYIYGYLNRIQSSRRLEKETQRNVEMMWLTERLMPDHKTIANFRKDYGASIRKASSEFIVLCRQLNLFTQSIVAIDGSKFHGVNSRSRNFTRAKLKKRMARIEKSLKEYFAELDLADQEDLKTHAIDIDKIKEKIAALKERMSELKLIEEQIKKLPDKQISLTDPDARSMRSNSETAGVIGYNVQSAVDIEHHLIVAHEVNNIGIDRAQLFNMAMKARTALNTEDLTALSDRGYYSGEQLLACEEAGIVTYVPKTNTSGARADGRFDRSDFRYIHEDDQYECPAGKRLIRHATSHEHGKTLYRYWRSDCPQCPLKMQCTPGKERRVTRWEHESVIEAAEARLQKSPEMMSVRKSTVEHPFGTIKSWMGSTHFLMKGLENVSTEMSLHVLAYNLKRVMSIIGIRPLIQAMQA